MEFIGCREEKPWHKIGKEEPLPTVIESVPRKEYFVSKMLFAKEPRNIDYRLVAFEEDYEP